MYILRINQTKNPKNQEGVIIPPGCDHPSLYDCGEEITTYIPRSYKQYDSTNLPIIHPIKSNAIPESKSPVSAKNMSEYLNKFIGADLCLDLIINPKLKIKKCGTLLEVGIDFLVLRESKQKRLTVIDLKPVKYINIYCK